MPDPEDEELWALIDRFVKPGQRYLKLLHGNFLDTPANEQSLFITSLLSDANDVTDDELGVLLSSEWRSRLTAAYLIAGSRREGFVDLLGDLLIESELVYAGQAYCIALASIGTPKAARRLSEYLDRWLPEVSARYDQSWAMAALMNLDDATSERSARFLGAGGPWDQWCQDRLELESQVLHVGHVLSAMSR